MKPASHERQILLLAMLTGLPGTAVALLLLWRSTLAPKFLWSLTAALVLLWLALAFAVRARVVFPLRTLANLLAALREGDFSIRARGESREDALGQLISEVNALASTLRQQRLGAVEATALLGKVMEEIDVAVFAFDPENRLRLVNRAGERVLGQDAEQLRGKTAGELHLEICLEGETLRTIEMSFPGGAGRFQLRRSTIREEGVPHHLLVLTDLSRTLREEERLAWQRLIRVLGHELNNSLAPVKSIADSISTLLARENLPADWREDTQRGLEVISGRVEALGRFTSAYARLARLPSPTPKPVAVGDWVRRVTQLESRTHVEVRPGPEITVQADPDQLDQLLINLVRNAADASAENQGGVSVGWRKDAGFVEIAVQDDGAGLSNTANLFVPFFTTKPGGSGIGLVLCRQIAEAHGGSLTLENRLDAHGCVARFRLPL
ncbi:MAG TPA: ATP-binding protein [Candidatus Acidoferrales bacterium]|nr:ATP-binding protein [Candidatus Acidoferrales bacterium]